MKNITLQVDFLEVIERKISTKGYFNEKCKEKRDQKIQIISRKSDVAVCFVRTSNLGNIKGVANAVAIKMDTNYK